MTKVIGAGLLWFGWFGFNGGSALGCNGLAANAFLVTNTAAAAAGLTWMFINWIYKRPSVIGTATGVVVGLVTITPSSGFVSATSAIIIGVVASMISYFCIMLRNRWKLDESLDVWACHGMGGTWGAIATGIFASKAINPAGADGLIHGNWQWRVGDYRIDLLPKKMVMMVVKDQDYKKVVDIICKVSQSGAAGDGKIFVSTVDEVIRIRTCESGENVL